VTRREWLIQNPPPRAGKSTQTLLDTLNLQNAKRAELVQLRQKWVTHKEYWSARVTIPGETAHAQQQVNDANIPVSYTHLTLPTICSV